MPELEEPFDPLERTVEPDDPLVPRERVVAVPEELLDPRERTVDLPERDPAGVEERVTPDLEAGCADLVEDVLLVATPARFVR
ncbi:MAG: hypothetical protein WD038_02375 [Balneolales bacterium]